MAVDLFDDHASGVGMPEPRIFSVDFFEPELLGGDSSEGNTTRSKVFWVGVFDTEISAVGTLINPDIFGKGVSNTEISAVGALFNLNFLKVDVSETLLWVHW